MKRILTCYKNKPFVTTYNRKYDKVVKSTTYNGKNTFI